MISAGNKEPYFEDNYEIFPNPVTESMIIKSNQYNTSYFEIIDMNGKTLLTGKFMFESTISISEFKSGIYILSIKSEKGYAKRQKFVIN